MNKDKIIIFDRPKDLAAGFAEILINKINSFPAGKDSVNIALSGGSTPIELFKILAADYKNIVNPNNVHYYWADERCVPADSAESNYGNARKYLFSKVEIEQGNIHRINGEAEPETEAVRYSDLVNANIPKKNNLPCFDIILLGIGEDGHTASIFPDQMELLTSDKIYAVSAQPETGQKRITITGRIINNAECVYFLVTGKSKALVTGDIYIGNTKDYPAGYVNPLTGELYWMLDEDAGSLLK